MVKLMKNIILTCQKGLYILKLNIVFKLIHRRLIILLNNSELFKFSADN